MHAILPSRAFAATALLSTLLVQPLGAQARFRVAVVDSVSTPGARAEVIRYPGNTQPPVLLVRASSLDVPTLVVALRTLHRAEQRQPTPQYFERTAITGFVALQAIPADDTEAARTLLALIARAPIVRIGALGRGRWAEASRPDAGGRGRKA